MRKVCGLDMKAFVFLKKRGNHNAMEQKCTPLGGDSLYGAVDLGTNTCRLLIGKPFGGPHGSFSTVSTFSRVIRFGEDVEQTAHLSSQAMDRALIVLKECARRLDLFDVQHKRCVTTAACRNAKNAPDFIQRVYDETKLNLEIVSPEEESALAVAGCADLFDETFPYSLVFDIGGGSTELVWLRTHPHQRAQILDCLSLPYGILSVRERDISDMQKRHISQLISFAVNEFAVRHHIYAHMNKNQVQMIGASGTITTLAAMILNLEYYDRSRVHQCALSRCDIEKMLSYLWAMSPSDRKNHPCIGPQRADFVMGGVAIFQGIYDILPIDPVLVADRGVREGIVRMLYNPETVFPRLPLDRGDRKSA